MDTRLGVRSVSLCVATASDDDGGDGYEEEEEEGECDNDNNDINDKLLFLHLFLTHWTLKCAYFYCTASL